MLDVMQEADLIRRVTKKVYWDSKFVRLRTQIEEEDLIQMVFLKLLHRENYKKYSDAFSLVGFLYRVANGCAVSYATKVENLREWTVLDKPMCEDEKRTLKDCLVIDTPYMDLDSSGRVDRIVNKLHHKVHSHLVIRNDETDIPFSLENLFRFFVKYKYSKRELITHVINVKTKSQVTQATFDKFWKAILKAIKKELES